MSFIPLRPEIIIPSQEVVMSNGDNVRQYMDESRIELARIALDNMIKAGERIDYESVGRSDSLAYDYSQELEANITSLLDERNRLEAWISRQHGVDVTKKPQLLTNIMAIQKRIDTITRKALPEAEASLEDFLPTAEETYDIAELTGQTWPYYPDLISLPTANELDQSKEYEENPTEDAAIRMDIQNIISRLSFDRKGGLGLRYDTLTAYFFTKLDADTKSRYAKTLANMIRDQEARKWNDGSTIYIESLLLLRSSRTTPEKRVKPIVLQMDINDENTRNFIEVVIRQLGTSGYKRIERGETLEIQVPHAYASAYAETHGMVLSKHGPSSYRFISNS